MSQLGIRFVLPYKGVNGLIVQGNQIGLDPNGEASLGTLMLNANFTKSDNSFIFKVNCDSSATGTPVRIFDKNQGCDVFVLKSTGDILTGSNLGALTSTIFGDFVVLTNDATIQYLTYNGGASLTEVIGEIIAANVVDPTKYFQININGSVYKLAIVN